MQQFDMEMVWMSRIKMEVKDGDFFSHYFKHPNEMVWFKKDFRVWQFFANDQAHLQKGQPSTTMCYIGNHMIHKISLASCKGDGWVL